MSLSIVFAETDSDIDRCYQVMRELRPHLSREEFLAQVQRQMSKSGFRLLYLSDAQEIQAVAGIRVAEWLARGKSLEIEDLVTIGHSRSKGYGSKLFDRIIEIAKDDNCTEVRLVSHVTRFDAHRFYLRKGMIIDAHFFSMSIAEKQ
jgi:GNAT superfamily N-acetyltransferase